MVLYRHPDTHEKSPGRRPMIRFICFVFGITTYAAAGLFAYSHLAPETIAADANTTVVYKTDTSPTVDELAARLADRPTLVQASVAIDDCADAVCI
jgi:hypothetical protein